MSNSGRLVFQDLLGGTDENDEDIRVLVPVET